MAIKVGIDVVRPDLSAFDGEVLVLVDKPAPDNDVEPCGAQDRLHFANACRSVGRREHGVVRLQQCVAGPVFIGDGPNDVCCRRQIVACVRANDIRRFINLNRRRVGWIKREEGVAKEELGMTDVELEGRTRSSRKMQEAAVDVLFAYVVVSEAAI